MITNSHIDQAIEFRTAMGQPIGTDDHQVHFMQWKLIDEEFIELTDAESGSVNELKELADLAYVCYQFAAAKGWHLDEALDRVHASNMSKLVDGKPLRREDGKILKGSNYQPPYLDDLV
jgi:predicted HAD superfamily Cof-like phosphohydrolase